MKDFILMCRFTMCMSIRRWGGGGGGGGGRKRERR